MILFTLVGTWHGSASEDPERHLGTGQRYVRHWGKAMGGAFKGSILCDARWKVISLLDAFCNQRGTFVLVSLHKAGSRAKEVLAGTWVFNSCECQCTSLLHSPHDKTNYLFFRLFHCPLAFGQCLKGQESFGFFCVPCHANTFRPGRKACIWCSKVGTRTRGVYSALAATLDRPKQMWNQT